MVDFSGLRPRFRIYAEAEKGRQDRLQQPLLVGELRPRFCPLAGLQAMTPNCNRLG